MNSRHVLSFIDRYSAVRVLCAGDVMLDRFVYGDVNRISPEAPIPVVTVREERSMLGGAGNVARNVASLGATLDFVTVIGPDAAGREVRQAVEGLENCTARIVEDRREDPRRRTSLKVRYLSHQQQILRVDSESAEPVSEEVFEAVLMHFRAALPHCGIVLLSDYAKGVLSCDRAARLIGAASEFGKPVFVDPKGADFTRYRGAALIKPNLAELRDATRMPLSSDSDVELAARALLDECGIGAMLVTRGSAGMMLVRPGRPVFQVRAQAREVFDVSGAGDTAAANLAVAAAAGLELEDAVRLANIAASVVVSRLGTATVTRDQLIWELEASEALSADRKIQDCALALEQVARWRRAGMRVRTLSGRFDMPTQELVDLLRSERAECDKLVLAVVTDGSAAVPAGEDAQRCVLLSALVWVDLVTPGSEDVAAAFVADVHAAR